MILHSKAESPPAFGSLSASRRIEVNILLLVQIVIVLVVALICGNISLRLGQARAFTAKSSAAFLLRPLPSSDVFPPRVRGCVPTTSFGLLEVLSNTASSSSPLIIGSELDFAHLRKQKRPFRLPAGEYSAAVHHGDAHGSCHPRPLRSGTASAVCLHASSEFAQHHGLPVLARILKSAACKHPVSAQRLSCVRPSTTFALWSLLAAAPWPCSTPEPTPLRHGVSFISPAIWAVMIGVIRPLGNGLLPLPASLSLLRTRRLPCCRPCPLRLIPSASIRSSEPSSPASLPASSPGSRPCAPAWT